jgi:hypothetical protein
MITSTINYSFRLNFAVVELDETRDFKSECNLCENLWSGLLWMGRKMGGVISVTLRLKTLSKLRRRTQQVSLRLLYL